MTVTAEPLTVAGVYDIPADVYHQDPVEGGSLSSSGARRLLPPSCPARYRWEQDNGQAPRKAWDLGTAAHRLVLGVGADLVRIDAQEWRSNEVKEQVAKVREAGDIPLRPSEYDQVHAMAKALREHPIAGPLFTPGRGEPEQTLIWQDPLTGVWRRAMLDWLPHATGRRLIIADYKTATSADAASFRKAVTSYGYHCQDAWYRDAVQALGLGGPDTAFVFVVQEKTPPYLVNVVELDPDAIRAGRTLNRRALNIYARCVETGHWPGYGDDDISLISLPPWHTREDSL